METWIDRLRIYTEGMNLLPDKNVANFLEFCFENQLQLQPIEKDNKNSQLYHLIFPRSKTLFLKKIPMIPEDFRILNGDNQINKTKLLEEKKTSIWREIYINRLCNQLLLKQISPHHIFYYGYHFSFDNINEAEYDSPNLITITEKMDYDLKTWVKKEERSEKQWMDLFYQLFFALFALQKNLKIFHRDLHWGNALFKTFDEPQNWSYKIGNVIVSLEEQEFLISICDFGHAVFQKDIFHGSENSVKDYKRIVLNIHRWAGLTHIPPNVRTFVDEVRVTQASTMTGILISIILPRLRQNKPASLVFNMTFTRR